MTHIYLPSDYYCYRLHLMELNWLPSEVANILRFVRRFCTASSLLTQTF